MGKSKPKNATPSTPKKIIPMKGQAGGKSFLKEEAIWSVALRLPIDSLAKPRVLTWFSRLQCFLCRVQFPSAPAAGLPCDPLKLASKRSEALIGNAGCCGCVVFYVNLKFYAPKIFFRWCFDSFFSLMIMGIILVIIYTHRINTWYNYIPFKINHSWIGKYTVRPMDPSYGIVGEVSETFSRWKFMGSHGIKTKNRWKIIIWYKVGPYWVIGWNNSNKSRVKTHPSEAHENFRPFIGLISLLITGRGPTL